MSTVSYNKHLTEADRQIIAQGILNNSSKADIARVLGKDKSTIGKEIKLHRVLKYKSSLPLDCANYKTCTHRRQCTLQCPDFVPFACRRRDRSPGACNGCKDVNRCRHDKFYYDPKLAHLAYRETLIDSRQGVNITVEEAKAKAEIIKPLLNQGLSPYQIVTLHPELKMSEKTLYTYIEENIFSVAGISALDLRRQPSRKLSKKRKTNYKKREDRSFLLGRHYTDYLHFLEENPDAHVVQMDTVYNDNTNGPFIQTFKFLGYGFLFALYHHKRTAEAMVSGIQKLDSILGASLFNQQIEVLLTDRGPEFSCAASMETREDGTRRTRVYYCDPMQSAQKGSLENNHIELRYILPKGVDLYKLGLTSQADLNLVLSHVNSFAKEKLHSKSPMEMLEFFHPELMQCFTHFGITKIEKDKVILKPYLLKK